DFDAALARCGTLDEDVLGRPWPFRGRPMDVRYALYRTLEDAQEVYVRVSAGAHPESRRILALAQHAFGGLRGLLAGLPGALLDKAPSTGEWPIREVLAHMLAVEQRYALQTRYAVDRTDADPMRIPDNRMPPTAPAPIAGEVGVVLARLAEARAETKRLLGDVAPTATTRRLRRHVLVRGARRVSRQQLDRRRRRRHAPAIHRGATARHRAAMVARRHAAGIPFRTRPQGQAPALRDAGGRRRAYEADRPGARGLEHRVGAGRHPARVRVAGWRSEGAGERGGEAQVATGTR